MIHKIALNAIPSNRAKGTLQNDVAKPLFQGDLKDYEKEYAERRAETSARIERAIHLYTDLLEKHFDEAEVRVTTENRDTSKSIRFHVSLPKAACEEQGLIYGFQLGIGFNGTTGLFGFGKPIVNVFSFFNTQADPNAKFNKGMIDSLDHTGLFTVRHNAGKPLSLANFKPYQAGWLHLKKLGFERLFTNGYSLYEEGKDEPHSELDKRQVKLVLKLLEKTQMQPEFDKMIQRIKGKLKDSHY